MQRTPHHMQLSPHFTLAEMTTTSTGLPNEPSADVIVSLAHTCEVLELIREAIGGHPIIINSGYRCPDVNKAVGGSKTSQHLSGRAADIRSPDQTPRTIWKTVQTLHDDGWIPELDQVILYESRGFVHVGLAWPGTEGRGMAMKVST